MKVSFGDFRVEVVDIQIATLRDEFMASKVNGVQGNENKFTYKQLTAFVPSATQRDALASKRLYINMLRHYSFLMGYLDTDKHNIIIPCGKSVIANDIDLTLSFDMDLDPLRAINACVYANYASWYTGVRYKRPVYIFNLAKEEDKDIIKIVSKANEVVKSFIDAKDEETRNGSAYVRTGC